MPFASHIIRLSLCSIGFSIAAAPAWSATECTYKNFTIGSEIIAADGPNQRGEYLYKLSTLRCDGNGQVIYTSSVGFSENYVVGWLKPAQLTDDPIVKSMAYNMRSFKNKCGTLLQNIHGSYRGSIAGVKLNGTYPPAVTPYVDVFKTPLHMQWGASVPPCDPPVLAPPPSNADACPVTGAPPTPGNKLPDPPINETCGNPIKFTTGNKVQHELDYVASGASLLSFSRRYDSQSPFIAKASGILGPRWTHNHEYRVAELTQSSQAYAIRPNGRVVYFTPKVGHAGSWVGGVGIHDTLQKTPSGWEYRSGNNEFELYDQNGRILSRTDPNGTQLIYTYDASGKLSQVADSFNRTLIFAYTATGLLDAVTLPDNSILQYDYDTQGQLFSVTYPDGTQRQYGYTSVTVNGILQDTLLNRLTDEVGTPFASWVYSPEGAAIRSEHAGGVETYSLNYQRDAGGKINGVVVTEPLNSQSSYFFTQVLGQNRPHEILRNVDSAKKTQQFDSNGNLTSLTGFTGTITTFEYDLTRNLETSRTEAKGTPQQRTITTEWHPTWRLIRKVTEPGRVTTYDWDNTTANLNSKTITADGKTRVWAWTYFDKGLVKTATDPDGKVTSYTYDTAGNVSTMTNPLGQVTQFNRYDANGNLLEMTAADGLKTGFTYDARNRLKTRQSGTALTSLDYWPTGLLKTATLPNGLVINYVYDAAQRLIEVNDNRGNREVYTLNKAGQIEQTDRTDPNNTLGVGLAQVKQTQTLSNAVAKPQ